MYSMENREACTSIKLGTYTQHISFLHAVDAVDAPGLIQWLYAFSVIKNFLGKIIKTTTNPPRESTFRLFSTTWTVWCCGAVVDGGSGSVCAAMRAHDEKENNQKNIKIKSERCHPCNHILKISNLAWQSFSNASRALSRLS